MAEGAAPDYGATQTREATLPTREAAPNRDAGRNDVGSQRRSGSSRGRAISGESREDEKRRRFHDSSRGEPPPCVPNWVILALFLLIAFATAPAARGERFVQQASAELRACVQDTVSLEMEKTDSPLQNSPVLQNWVHGIASSIAGTGAAWVFSEPAVRAMLSDERFRTYDFIVQFGFELFWPGFIGYHV